MKNFLINSIFYFQAIYNEKLHSHGQLCFIIAARMLYWTYFN